MVPATEEALFCYAYKPSLEPTDGLKECPGPVMKWSPSLASVLLRRSIFKV